MKMQRPYRSTLRPFSRPADKDAIRIVAAHGCTLTDDSGRNYFDALASLWYCNVGHGRTEMIDAISAQMHRLDAFHTFEQFSNDVSEELADRLIESAPIDSPRVMFTSGGSESVDTAIKLARIAHSVAGETARTIVVSREPSYHGVTYGGMTLTGMEPNRAGFGPEMGGVERLPWADLDAMRALFEHCGDRIAAVFAEPVIAGGGLLVPPDGYLNGIRDLCDRYGAFMVADEVVCGFGRLGTFWGSERFGVRPDMITFAKGATSGYFPLGGVIVGERVRRPLEGDPELMLMHGHTYSGHPSGCAAGLEALRLQEDENLAARALAIGGRLETGLDEMVENGLIAEARGMGGIWGAVLEDQRRAEAVWSGLFERGVIARRIRGSIIAICPPLVASDEEIDHVLAALSESAAVAAETTQAKTA